MYSVTRDNDDDDDDSSSNPPQDSSVAVNAEYPVASRLKVKYGKGKNYKVYDAKVSM